MDINDYDIMNDKAEKLLGVLHELKHRDGQYAYDLMTQYFPHWRNVEWYNPNMGSALFFLFEVVLCGEEDENDEIDFEEIGADISTDRDGWRDR